MSKNHRFVLGTLAVAAIMIRPGPITADDKPEPHFQIAPKVWFVGDPKLNIRVVNLQPKQKVTVVGHSGRDAARISRIEGVADDRGEFDLRGAYEPGPKTGAPFRILWDSKDDPGVEPVGQVGLHRLRAEVVGKTVATGSLQIDTGGHQEPKPSSIPVKERGLHGEFFLPPGQGPFPGVILFGGSEGGLGLLTRLHARVLAKHGFACQAVAYFDSEKPQDFPGLPERLIDVPLEYFETAIAWMKENKQVRGDRLAVMGGSRGGELALLLGSMFPDVKAVIAYTPSHVVWSGWPLTDEEVKAKNIRPAWTYKGKPVPYMARDFAAVEVKKLKEENPRELRVLFAHYLKEVAAVRAAAISVEKISGPVLMITGTDDRVWPAGDMAVDAMKRLAVKGHPYRNQHLSYEGCGHSIGLPLSRPNFGVFSHQVSKEEYDSGGSLEANSYAAWDSWPKIVKFLGDNLK
jgi:acetyl esterase/lipase